MKILVSSIVDLKKSQHNRPHRFVEHLSRNHEVTVLSINDWWKGKQGDLESYNKSYENVLSQIDYEYITNRKISPIAQELLSFVKAKKLIKKGFDAHLNYNTLISRYKPSRSIPTVYDLADDLSAMIRASPQIPSMLRPFGGALGDHMIKRSIKAAKKITVTTEHLQKTYGIPSEKLEVVPNGVDTKAFTNQGDTKRN